MTGCRFDARQEQCYPVDEPTKTYVVHRLITYEIEAESPDAAILGVKQGEGEEITDEYESEEA